MEVAIQRCSFKKVEKAKPLKISVKKFTLCNAANCKGAILLKTNPFRNNFQGSCYEYQFCLTLF